MGRQVRAQGWQVESAGEQSQVSVLGVLFEFLVEFFIGSFSYFGVLASFEVGWLFFFHEVEALGNEFGAGIDLLKRIGW